VKAFEIGHIYLTPKSWVSYFLGQPRTAFCCLVCGTVKVMTVVKCGAVMSSPRGNTRLNARVARVIAYSSSLSAGSCRPALKVPVPSRSDGWKMEKGRKDGKANRWRSSDVIRWVRERGSGTARLHWTVPAQRFDVSPWLRGNRQRVIGARRVPNAAANGSSLVDKNLQQNLPPYDQFITTA